MNVCMYVQHVSFNISLCTYLCFDICMYVGMYVCMYVQFCMQIVPDVANLSILSVCMVCHIFLGFKTSIFIRLINKNSNFEFSSPASTSISIISKTPVKYVPSMW